MKIGILTFHWATNFGAILQTFALQSYLSNIGFEVSVINYRPGKYKLSLFKCFMTLRVWHIKKNILEYLKEVKLERFRDKYLNQTREYNSLIELKSDPPTFDVYICGSDQIWNPYFTLLGEGKPTSTYFLDFGDKNIRRIAYAVSYGCEYYSETATSYAKDLIANFKAISVRELSGVKLTKTLGYMNPQLLPDPTLLLDIDKYNFNYIPNNDINNYVFVYLLRDNPLIVKSLISKLNNYFEYKLKINWSKVTEIENWLTQIRNSQLVVTNSYHGMIFSIIFHKPFLVVPAKGNLSGMNDRFNTLLKLLNLEDRILIDFDNVNHILDKKIDWIEVDERIKSFRNQTKTFFDSYIN